MPNRSTGRGFFNLVVLSGLCYVGLCVDFPNNPAVFGKSGKLSLVDSIRSFSVAAPPSVGLQSTDFPIDSAPASLTTAVPTKTTWTYTKNVDYLTDNINRTASVLSDNYIVLDWPFQEAQHVQLIIRQSKEHGGLDAFLVAERGVINHALPITVRFDDERPHKYGINESANGNPSTAFIESPSAFVQKLHGAKKLRIGVWFWRTGQEELWFYVDGFDRKLLGAVEHSETPAVPLYAPTQPPAPTGAATTPDSYTLGPRGGCYYINHNGNKTYVDRSMCKKTP